MRPRKCIGLTRPAPSKKLLQWGRGLAAAEMHDREQQPAEQGRASMGPRPCGRGNVLGVWALQRPRGCFNGAAALRPRKSRRHCPEARHFHRLQWGRGLAAAEMMNHRKHACSSLDASMGPRPCGRGNVVSIAMTRVERLASMGPRPCGRGNLGRRWQRSGQPGFNGAAALRPRKSEFPALLRATFPGFNGAAALRPRKCYV